MSRPARAERNRLRQALHHARDAGLVDHLGKLPGAAAADARARARKCHGHGLDHVERCLVPPAHHREHTLLRARLPPRYRRIDELQTRCKRAGVQLPRHLGRGRRVIHKNGTRLHARKGAITAQHHRTQIVVVADAAEHQVGALRRLARRCGTFGGSIACEFSAPCF